MKKAQPKGIPSVKRQHILILTDSFPAAKTNFGQEIPVNDDNADLVA